MRLKGYLTEKSKTDKMVVKAKKEIDELRASQQSGRLKKAGEKRLQKLEDALAKINIFY